MTSISENNSIRALNPMLVTLTLALALCVASLPAEAGEGDSGEEGFETATVQFEQNATDGDVEVVFKINGGEDGMKELTIVSPDGRKVIDFKTSDAATLGIRQFVFESPEPTDVPSLKAAYPAGVYRVTGRDMSGETLTAEMKMSHELPPTTKSLGFAEGQVAWDTVAGVKAYVVEIEHERLGVSIVATLPADATTFSVPAGFLVSGKKYGLALSTVSEDGNTSSIEMSFRAP